MSDFGGRLALPEPGYTEPRNVDGHVSFNGTTQQTRIDVNYPDGHAYTVNLNASGEIGIIPPAGTFRKDLLSDSMVILSAYGSKAGMSLSAIKDVMSTIASDPAARAPDTIQAPRSNASRGYGPGN